MTSEIILVGVILILGLGAYWSMVIFPRQRDFQKRQRYLTDLKPGDEMITYGGIIGRVQEIRYDEGIAFVEIADGIVVRVLLAALVRPFDPDELRSAAQKALGQPEA
ncbi:MAG: preprotein translocase subunit YajC [Candidatus Flexifilum sp.]